jgi:hypothetical protein
MFSEAADAALAGECAQRIPIKDEVIYLVVLCSIYTISETHGFLQH